MSEYQYYEFQAIDRPLDRAAQQALRSISSRARITATSFTNHYDWGDLKGDPRKFMERWFDLGLYLSNWGLRRLMMRLPKRFLGRADLAPFLGKLDWVKVWTSGDNLIVDIWGDEEEPDGDWGDGSGWLAAVAPLRADVLSGDLRIFYLLWLAAIAEGIGDDATEPLPGIGPLSGAIEAFAEFFAIGPDLVQAAAEHPSGSGKGAFTDDLVHEALAAMSEREKTDFLLRFVKDDSLVVAELKGRVRALSARPSDDLRKVGELRARATAIRQARERAEAKRLEAERRRGEREAEKRRRVRLDDVKRRGTRIWDDIEVEIARRNTSGYETAAGLIFDLKAVAAEQGTFDDFARRLKAVRERHARKGKFIERLKELTAR